ncbi:MAG: Asp-tRNA(Asn)/Glu-tRNA(Gln) amidotransferase subunit GatA [Rothia sp. (in: high G+C Gram-positive bacteria)]|uniref:Asp-tRNA(Asn)/Glu-tRNA(Gln) amidotransferase subunit GatA n=1 Tax=Rothia sp. (in: high G+C Gram-positive bacteria) TaxID=1885016 RepID=UPI0026E083D3|nr:Asp-tRNA(Asn)/Glu-tRNA(Gln) amidotransferase subunit GatA [Rothia sp. (in: high G+C Gram-positive bacteria)]MDO5750349.1 Asp-tRNA(Asn)/Glu-tRNA(Gln) amidotransferase subunit GatA [Rothia sp. (in: high G+C Gram-positive bacteria)]
MTELIKLTAAEAAAKLAAGEITSVELTQAHLDHIAATDGAQGLNAFLHVNAEEALAEAAAVDADRAAGKELPALAGVPIAIKDLIVTKGQPTTAASKMLEGWMSPYDGTVTQKVRAARMPILGKTNLDEFAMGSSNEHSAFGPVRNPWDLQRVPGGSGGGSAAAVSAFQAPLALGTDTGGSIRQPAALTGSVGVKPTYGSVSRSGVIAMASSLDQVGPCARTVLDTALLHEVIAGHDPLDSTSLNEPVPAFAQAAREGAQEGSLKGLRVGVIKELGGGSGKGFQHGVIARFMDSLELLQAAGAEIVEVSLPSVQHAISAYYMIMSSEVSSNLARYDGVRYGLRVVPEDGPVTIERVMAATRAAGFGNEVKRRIILGTYALSAGNFEAYYGAALKVRTLIQRDYAAAFEKVDVLVSPTSPTTAFKLGEKTKGDPTAMYLGDIATVPTNLAGVPSISLPAGVAEEDGMPVGIQFTAPAREDARLYRVAAGLEKLLTDKWGAPFYTRIPDVTETIRDFDFGGTK